ncbi:MAG: hypothetical protein QNJ54_19535 [Prochloraceae cyanobacterium]|nr:hypothetical protein [Prochloraceae cyanobacterium]
MARPKKIAILIESHYDGNETAAFETFFPVKEYEIILNYHKMVGKGRLK